MATHTDEDIARTIAAYKKVRDDLHLDLDAVKDIFGYELEAFLEVPAKFRGFQAGVKMAEAFRPSYRWGRTFSRHYLPDCLEAVKR